MGSIFNLWSKLPERLAYQGYEFRLILRGQFIGYFLTRCLKKRGYKMAAFKEGVWWENQISRQMSSVGSDFLIKAVLFDDSDNALHEAFKTLCDFLILHHFPLRETMENTLKTEDTDFIYIQPLQLFEGFEPSKSDSTPF